MSNFGMPGFGMIAFGIVPIMFYLIFFMVFGTIIVRAVKGMTTWH